MPAHGQLEFVPTEEIMDTNLGVAARGSVRGKYKHHPLSFKRAVVEETLRE